MSEVIQESTQSPPTTEVNGVAPTPPPAEESAPKTPGEAAKEVRLRGELHARQQRLKKHTDEFHKTRAAFEEEKRAWAAERAKVDEEHKSIIAQLQKEVKELRDGNPLKRMSPEQANATLREFVNEGAPEVQIQQLRKALEERDAAFEAYKKEQMTAAEKREAAEAKAREDAAANAEQNQLRGFVQQVFNLKNSEGKQAFPHICAEMTQSELLAKTNEIVQAGKKLRWIGPDGAPRVGKFYTGQEIADYLEKVSEKSYNDRMTRIQGLGLIGAPAATNPAVKGSNNQASQPASGNGSSGGNKYQKRHLSEQEKERAERDALAKAMAKDKAAFEAAKRK